MSTLLAVPLSFLALQGAPETRSTTPLPVPYADLVTEPAAHLGDSVPVVLQFHSLVEDWNPFLTRFGTGEFLALQAWADEQLPWVEEEYERPAVRFFVRRGGPMEEFARSLSTHDRLRVTCVVRELFAGRVWAEVVAAEPLAEQIPEGTVLHVLRGIDLMGRKAWDLADSEFERALAAPVPAHAWDAVAELRKRCLAEKTAAAERKKAQRRRQG